MLFARPHVARADGCACEPGAPRAGNPMRARCADGHRVGSIRADLEREKHHLGALVRRGQVRGGHQGQLGTPVRFREGALSPIAPCPGPGMQLLTRPLRECAFVRCCRRWSSGPPPSRPMKRRRPWAPSPCASHSSSPTSTSRSTSVSGAASRPSRSRSLAEAIRPGQAIAARGRGGREGGDSPVLCAARASCARPHRPLAPLALQRVHME